MKEIIDKVLREEEKAHRRLQEARLEAEKIINDAKSKKEEIILKTISAANENARLQKEEAEKRILEEKEKILEDAKRAFIRVVEQKEKEIPDISRRIFSHIIEIKL